MNQSIKVRKAQTRPILDATYPDYRGRKFKVEFTDKVWLHDTNWGGGSRNYYAFVTADGERRYLPSPPPWDNPYEGRGVELPANVLVVEHCYFCGKDLGITIYAHPSYAPKWLAEGGK